MIDFSRYPIKLGGCLEKSLEPDDLSEVIDKSYLGSIHMFGTPDFFKIWDIYTSQLYQINKNSFLFDDRLITLYEAEKETFLEYALLEKGYQFVDYEGGMVNDCVNLVLRGWGDYHIRKD